MSSSRRKDGKEERQIDGRTCKWSGSIWEAAWESCTPVLTEVVELTREGKCQYFLEIDGAHPKTLFEIWLNA